MTSADRSFKPLVQGPLTADLVVDGMHEVVAWTMARTLTFLSALSGHIQASRQNDYAPEYMTGEIILEAIGDLLSSDDPRAPAVVSMISSLMTELVLGETGLNFSESVTTANIPCIMLRVVCQPLGA